jgi:Ran GTPase-activating protein (RanGAP) involved in mRNA processing and transport
VHLCRLLTRVRSLNKKGASGSFTEAAQAFSSLEKLSRLSLNRNQLGDEAAFELAKVFQTHPSLVVVKLQNNKIGTAGAAAIFDALKTNTSVTQVSLSYNLIGNDALRYDHDHLPLAAEPVRFLP